MGLNSAMYTSLTGLNASQQRLDVTGNNIANVNTIAYKGSRTVFETQLSQTLSGGSSPTANSGGTNPMQIGLGVGTAAIQKDFTGGSIETTGVNTDVAIQGSGFFVIKDGTGNTMYTRDGAFKLDANQRLVTVDGSFVQGYGVDNNFNIVTGAPTNLYIPVGRLSVAQATTNAVFKNNLDSSGSIATTPGMAISEKLIDMTTGTDATSSTALINLATAANPGVALFATNDVITLSGTKGTRNLESANYTVTGGATVADLNTFIQNTMGIDSSAPQSTTGGVSIVNGQITVVGNLGADNSPEIKLTSSGAVPNPLTWATSEGDGTSKYTGFLVYDSLGNAVNVNATFVLESKSTTGNTWRFYVESPDDSDSSPYIGTGTITFDNTGKFVEATGTNIVINRANLGAVDPISMTLDFSKVTGLSANGESDIFRESQDGYPTGTLNDYSIGEDGTIIGSFSNGMTKTLGQIVLANFSNPEGLIEKGNNCYIAGPNSGDPNVTTAGNLGTGSLIGGALELSNIDITKEFIDMVSASTAFSAAGKVITTSQQLLTELMTMIR